MISALAYIEETLLCAEVVRLLPKFMTPYVLLYLPHGVRLTLAASLEVSSHVRLSPTRSSLTGCCPSPNSAAWSVIWQILARKFLSMYVYITSCTYPRIPANTLYRTIAFSGLWKHLPRTLHGRQSVSCTNLWLSGLDLYTLSQQSACPIRISTHCILTALDCHIRHSRSLHPPRIRRTSPKRVQRTVRRLRAQRHWSPSARLFHQGVRAPDSRRIMYVHSFLYLVYVTVNNDLVSTRRSALQPFTLADGSHANVGDWFCTPVRAIMTNPADYPEALQFSGFRFADPNLVRSLSGNTSGKLDRVMQKKPTKLTDVDMTYHVWGTGRMAW